MTAKQKKTPNLLACEKGRVCYNYSMDAKEYKERFDHALSNFGGLAEADFDFQCLHCRYYIKASFCTVFPNGISDETLADELKCIYRER